MMEKKSFRIGVDPRVLQFLGPSLYTNVYYVLAELIANAWDADAKNVYVIEKEGALIVEDDGKGMSYYAGDTDHFLKVAEETRIDESQSKTEKGRLKMGRKGIGKLAALAAAPVVNVLTNKNGEKTGFVLVREIPSSGELEEIPPEKIVFEKITGNGTSIQMINPEYKLGHSIETVAQNILKLFPVIGKDFKITIIKNGTIRVLNSFDKSIVPELAAIITLGEDYKSLNKLYKRCKGFEKDYIDNREQKEISISMLDKNKNEVNVVLKIVGWIGAYMSTKARRAEQVQFQDNYLSIYSRGKIGEFNIIPRVGANRLAEVYVVGQLHVDLFEDSSLPDMALSNRQGYKDDDIRYIKVMEYAEQLLKDVVDMRAAWTSEKNRIKDKEEYDKKQQLEKEFKEKVDNFESDVAKSVASKVKENDSDDKTRESIENAVKEAINEHRQTLGLKPKIDSNKKKVLISHTKSDADFANVVYDMLVFNGIPAKDIIYTSSINEESRVPDTIPLYDYLREFFVESYSNEKIYAIYITSKAMKESWGAVIEVGASWITRLNHKIFNINVEGDDGYKPEIPLNVSLVYQNTKRTSNKNELVVDAVNADNFCVKIENICEELGYVHKTREENLTRLRKTIIIE